MFEFNYMVKIALIFIIIYIIFKNVYFCYPRASTGKMSSVPLKCLLLTRDYHLYERFATRKYLQVTDKRGDNETHRDGQKWSPSLLSARLCRVTYHA